MGYLPFPRHVLPDRCLIMGILNVTPDSFSDGGLFRTPERAIAHGLAMAEAGADLIDVGGESTRPGAIPPGADEEMARVLPVINALRRQTEILVSVDTSEPQVMRAAVGAGADMLNDVRALTRPGALEFAVEAKVPVCLMHMQGEPGAMQTSPAYDDVVGEVREFLLERAEQCVAAGMARDALILDPGFGFGKSTVHNLALLRGLGGLVATGYPVLVGLSRKSLIARLLGQSPSAPPEFRLAGSLALALAARARGARIVRVHDVAETAQAFRIMDALEGQA